MSISRLVPEIDTLPTLSSLEEELDPIVHVRLFAPTGRNAVWYVAAASKDARRVSKYEDDYILAVYADLGDSDLAEWGYQSLRELEAIRLPFLLRIERSVAFKPVRFSETPHGRRVQQGSAR